MSILEDLVGLAVIAWFVLTIYSGFKRQSLAETWAELIAKLKGGQEDE